jgi:hypothetical protein
MIVFQTALMCPVEASRALVPVLDGGSFNVVNFVTLGAVLAFLKSQAASVAEVGSSAVLPLALSPKSRLGTLAVSTRFTVGSPLFIRVRSYRHFGIVIEPSGALRFQFSLLVRLIVIKLSLSARSGDTLLTNRHGLGCRHGSRLYLFRAG